jgi:hypothetical protein
MLLLELPHAGKRCDEATGVVPESLEVELELGDPVLRIAPVTGAAAELLAVEAAPVGDHKARLLSLAHHLGFQDHKAVM